MTTMQKYVDEFMDMYHGDSVSIREPLVEKVEPIETIDDMRITPFIYDPTQTSRQYKGSTGLITLDKIPDIEKPSILLIIALIAGIFILMKIL